MDNWFVSKGARGSNNGTSWANAWNELDQINWGKVSAGDTIWLDGGTQKKVYTKTLNIGKSGASRNNRIKIKRSEEHGRNGYVVIFGGRNNDLPHANISTHRWREEGSGQKASGIHMKSYANIEIDGGVPRGITIHGWNNAGIDAYGSNGGGHRFANLEIYSNGTIQTVSGKYKTDKAGIRLSGKNVLIERCIIRNNGQDAIQNVGGQRPDHAVIRHCFLANTIAHIDIPHITWNYNRHPDGVQLYTGGENITIEDCLIMGMWHGLILGDSQGDFKNGTVRRITFIDNATAIRWHGRATASNNQVDDIVIKKWRWYPNDNGIGYPNGGNYYLKGNNNKHNRFLIAGYGAFTIYGSGNQWSNMYTDGSLDDRVPNAKTVDPKFANPGPKGNRGENIAHGWQARDLKLMNRSIDINIAYSGPLDYLRQQSGKNHSSYPAAIHANKNNNERPIVADNPILLNLSPKVMQVHQQINLQIEATHPQGATITFSATGLPPNVSMNSSGLIAGQLENAGSFSVNIVATGGGGTASGTFLLQVDPDTNGDTGTQQLVFTNPGPQSSQVGVFEQLELQISNPNQSQLTFSVEGLPIGLNIDKDTGVISGTPSQNGHSNVSVTVESSAGTKATQSFEWTTAAKELPTLTKLFEIPMQQITLNDSVNLQVGTSNTSEINATSNNLPPGIKVQTGVFEKLNRENGSSANDENSNEKQIIAISAEADGKTGDGGNEVNCSVIQKFVLGKVNGNVFTISHKVSAHPTLNPGAPTINGTSWGYTQIKCGGGDGIRFNLITIDLSQPIEQLDYQVGGISAPEEDIINISNDGSTSNLASADSSLISWKNLGGIRQLSFTYKSNSSGNNSFFAPKNNILVYGNEDQGHPPQLEGQTIEVDTTKSGFIGSTGAGTTQTYYLDDVINDKNVSLTQILTGSPNSNNPGDPFLVGITGGYSEFSTGGQSGLRTNRVRIVCNQPFKNLVWAVRGIHNDSDIEGIAFVSNKGTVSGLGNNQTGMVRWSNLPENTTEVYFDIVSNSSGNNAGFGPIGDITLYSTNLQSEMHQIQLVGTPTAIGTYDCQINVEDSTGFVGNIPVKFEII